MATRTDNFNRADAASLGTPSGGGAAWVDTQSRYGIISNQGYFAGAVAGAVSPIIATLDCAVTDMDVQMTIVSDVAGSQIGVHARYVDDSNHFAFWVDPSNTLVKFYRIQAAGFNLLGSAAHTFGANDVLKLTVRGNVWNAYVNGSLIIGPVTDSFQNTATKGGIWFYTGDNTSRLEDFSLVDQSASSTFTVAPTSIPKNHSGNITLTLAGSGTAWDGTTVFTPSGVTGVTKISQNVTSATAATVVVTTDATHTGTLTITESVTGTATATTTVATATLAFTPTTGAVSTTPTLTLTGANTVWTQETAAGLFTVSGGTGSSIGTPTITTNTAGTVVLTTGSAVATLTVTDTSTGATATFNVSRTVAANFYVRLDGNDSNTGTADTSGGAWLTVSKASTGPAGGYIAGDTLTFDGTAGTTFSGNLTWGTSGTQAARCVIGGTNGAIISPSNGTGVYVLDAEFVTVQNLIVTGSGVSPSDGTTSSTGWGILFFDDRISGSQWRDNRILGCTISGTQSGIGFKCPTPDTMPPSVVGFDGITVKSCVIHDIQQAAVTTSGGTAWLQAPPYSTTTDTGVFNGVYVGYCTVYNVFGTAGVYDRTMWLVGTIGGVVERCVVHNCGERTTGLSDNAQIMWLNASYCIIQYCECYSNFGGSVIDLDLETDHCIIQYCYTHENDGAGLMEYSSTSTNIIRYSISRNDTGYQDGGAFRLHSNGQFYGNTIISDAGVISGSDPLVLIEASCLFANNVLVGNGGLKLITIASGTPTIVGNLYYTGNPTTANFDGSITTLTAWRSAGHESVNGRTFGVIGDPLLSNPTGGSGTGTLPGAQVGTVTYFDPASNSPIRGAGAPPELLGVLFGPSDFHSYPNRTGATEDIGAVVYGASSLVPGFGGGTGGFGFYRGGMQGGQIG